MTHDEMDGEAYQDDHFDVRCVGGRTVRHLSVFSSDDGVHAEKLLVNLDGLGWFDCYISAFIAFWCPISEDDLAAIRADYADDNWALPPTPEIDLGARLGLAGAIVESVHCRRGARGVIVCIRTNRGTLSLREVDPKDPHSDTRLVWAPS